jgi:hypothetical protein
MTELSVVEGLKEEASQRGGDMANTVTIGDGTTTYYKASATTAVATADPVSHGMAAIWTPMPMTWQRCLKNWNWST